VWRRAGRPALAWAVGVACALVAIGDHVPTDVLGGALLAAALVPVAANYAR
jgi:membrane-associated phospholipid phosphatase